MRFMREKFGCDFQLYRSAGVPAGNLESIPTLKSKIAALTPEFTNLIMREAPRTVQKNAARAVF